MAISGNQRRLTWQRLSTVQAVRANQWQSAAISGALTFQRLSTVQAVRANQWQSAAISGALSFQRLHIVQAWQLSIWLLLLLFPTITRRALSTFDEAKLRALTHSPTTDL